TCTSHIEESQKGPDSQSHQPSQLHKTHSSSPHQTHNSTRSPDTSAPFQAHSNPPPSHSPSQQPNAAKPRLSTRTSSYKSAPKAPRPPPRGSCIPCGNPNQTFQTDYLHKLRRAMRPQRRSWRP
ncbi:hypothetical protein PanWU01x14_184370, partial [Parasponia andersonii]